MKLFDPARPTYRISLWFYYALAASIFSLALSSANGESTVKPTVKPRGAATITPRGWYGPHYEFDHSFECPNTVLIGSRHTGDEKGDTFYHCAYVEQFELLSPVDGTWTDGVDESRHSYTCPPNTIMTGRYHYDDENGHTKYQCSSIKDSWGNPVQVINGPWVDIGKYENSTYTCPENQVVTGRAHEGDTENGHVSFKCGTLW